MHDLSEDIRLPDGCPNCGSHRARVSRVGNPDDKVFCASCNTVIGLYGEVKERLIKASPGEAEQLLEEAANKKSS
ncbi:hypothetical protein IEI94_13755 [Halomonas sp. ML-15]|uniref:hypothetical protein n=1 Tax=Halomonas sp. ML-15 TaxID=2773305 RepID=UPI00174639AB|nr:hypothetical protein [Halomonas sp. ML-15]MBD3896917.1 hypothetical protein [Halomonas sp. ML-15]